MTKKKVCVVTGSRAEYGLLYWTMKEIEQSQLLQLQLCVTASHLLQKYGNSYEQILADGFSIDARVPILSEHAESSAFQVGIALAKAVEGHVHAFQDLKPDLVLVLGDRYEILAAAQAAMVLAIPIAHIHGGEITEGAMDEVIRHAVTKLSHLHFVATDSYRDRVIQLGEQADRVFYVGAPGLEQIKRMELLSAEALDATLSIPFAQAQAKKLLVTYHPETLASVSIEKSLEIFLSALDNFSDAQIVITGANADAGGDQINRSLQSYAEKNKDRVDFSLSLGQHRYLSAMKYCDVVVGNSSSAIIESPFMPKASVNIGDRQAGRIRSDSIIDCALEKASICEAIDRALSSDFQQFVQRSLSKYGAGDSARLIVEKLERIDFTNLAKKKFYDLEKE